MTIHTNLSLLSDVLPKELLDRLISLPDDCTEYSERYFSIAKDDSLRDRLHNAKRRKASSNDPAVTENLRAIIALVEETMLHSDGIIWQGYLIVEANRIEFAVSAVLGKRVVSSFKIK